MSVQVWCVWCVYVVGLNRCSFPNITAIANELANQTASPARLRFMVQSYLVSLYLDCPEGMGIHCPTAAQVGVSRGIAAAVLVLVSAVLLDWVLCVWYLAGCAVRAAGFIFSRGGRWTHLVACGTAMCSCSVSLVGE